MTLGIAMLLGIAALAILAPLVSAGIPDAPVEVVRTRFLSPGTVDHHGILHPLGTDRLGRDVWTRLVFGARLSLLVGALTIMLSLLIGTAVGLVAGVSRGILSTFLLGITDFVLGIPRVVLLLLLAALWDPGAVQVVVVLGLTGWMPIARLVYAETRAQQGRPYVTGARALGASSGVVLVRHILPHARTPLLAAVTLGVGNAITLEAGLSFLGLGVQPPAASWGTLIASGRDSVVNAPWVGLAPGIALVVVVIACTLVADAIQDTHRVTSVGGRGSAARLSPSAPAGS